MCAKTSAYQNGLGITAASRAGLIFLFIICLMLPRLLALLLSSFQATLSFLTPQPTFSVSCLSAHLPGNKGCASSPPCLPKHQDNTVKSYSLLCCLERKSSSQVQALLLEMDTWPLWPLLLPPTSCPLLYLGFHCNHRHLTISLLGLSLDCAWLPLFSVSCLTTLDFLLPQRYYPETFQEK